MSDHFNTVLLTVAEAAKRLHRSPGTIRRWTKLPRNHPGWLECIDLPGGILIPLPALEDCLRRRQEYKRATLRAQLRPLPVR
jgi:hypothetical protein